MGDDAQHELPGSAEMSRRSFFQTIAAVLGAIAAAVAAVPVVWMLVGGIYRRREPPYSAVGSVASLPTGVPVDLSFVHRSDEAYLREAVTQDVWVIKHSPTEVTVFSPICPHLGCHYDWDAQAQQFRCPCHGSIFAADGKLLRGPARRALDTLPHKIEHGQLLVQWERFAPGIPQKVVV